MTVQQKAFKARRQYNQWVTNQTLEDFALRYTPQSSRRWHTKRVVMTALSAITFLALEAIGGALTLTYGFSYVIAAVGLVSVIIFLLSLPIAVNAARHGLDIDLLTRGAGFGYLGSTVTSLIYATFTFIFFALEAAIMAMALNMLFGLPLHLGYLISSLVVIPLVTWGFTFISRFQQFTQFCWLALQLLPFVFILLRDNHAFSAWIHFPGFLVPDDSQFDLLRLGAVCSVLLSLVSQVGEQVDQVRFLPDNGQGPRWKWYGAVIAAGPGWIVIGAIKILLGSFLAVLAFNYGLGAELASEPTHMYLVAFSYVTHSSSGLLALTGIFVVLSQLKINVTNAYAGSIAWSNFFLRLTHRHPGRVVWLFFNVGIALLLMELGVYRVFEDILGVYAVAATAWLGSVVADLTVNKWLRLRPEKIEFRRAYLYDINPVGIGAMGLAMAFGLSAWMGWFGQALQVFASLFSLVLAFCTAPLIAWLTQGRFYLARNPVQAISTECCVCGNHFEKQEMSFCPFYQGSICSLCCSLDVQCNDACKPHARYHEQAASLLKKIMRGNKLRVDPRVWSFLSILLLFSSVIGLLLMLVFAQMRGDFGNEQHLLAATLWKVFFILLIVTGVTTWLFVLTNKSRQIAQDELRLQSDRLMKEIIAHEATDRQLQQAKEAADDANLAKSRYLTGITHELRTPLNAMLGYAQLLERADDIPPARQRGISIMRRSGEHLANLIEGLLDISKIEAGKLEIYREEVRIGELVQQLVAMFEQQAIDKGLTFNYNPPHWLPDAVMTDEKRLRQILINLLSNAIKFTDKGGVTLDFQYRSELAFFSVHDTGIGIGQANLERIFNPFERVSQDSRRTGTGLGLTITRLLTYVMGGDLQVESVQGTGSTFKLTLMLPSYSGASYQPVEPKKVVGYLGRRQTVLVVDDDPAHRQLMDDLLTPIGFIVLSAESAAQALVAAADNPVDLFLLDVAMPVTSGWELRNKLQCHGFTQPVIMISAEAGEGKSRDNTQEKELRYLVKPVQVPLLLESIGEALQLTWDSEHRLAVNQENTVGSTGLTGAQINEMKDLARLGYVRGLRELLSQHTNAKSISTTDSARLNELTDCFRFEEIVSYLEQLGGTS
ncbi:hybrid sensor histidine kinase/response regulator [Mangrovibacter yixingensis]|uniref:hybrid sensor histidine kinase/response regulator n=1 Tax=Mangrovibacter yixingensis TaxID=1529639 RepID=UPI001CFA67F7|nr:ATP-binding protein [Mangrovibacter yixingensis]